MRVLSGALIVAGSLPAAQADWMSDLLDNALGAILAGDDDISLDASVVAASDTDLDLTAAATLHTGSVDLNVTVAVGAAKCDTRNLQATVEVDMITPDIFAQGFCWLTGRGCASVHVTTNLFSKTYSLGDLFVDPIIATTSVGPNSTTTPTAAAAAAGDVPLEFVLNLTPWNTEAPVTIVFGAVRPMFTGLSFTVEAYGLAAGAISIRGDSLGGCTILDDVLAGVGITEEDLGLDDGALCGFLGGAVNKTNDLLAELGLDANPINVGTFVAKALDAPLAWLDVDSGTFTLGQNSALCQLTPDPFRVVFEDVGGNALDELVAGVDTIVDAFVDTANRCLGGGASRDYFITTANFADMGFEQDAETGRWVLTGSIWGGAGKNPVGIFSCLHDAVGPIELQDGSTVTPGDMTVETAADECDDNEQYAQCDGSAPPPSSPMQSFEPGATDANSTVLIAVCVCVSAVVLAAVIAAAVVVSRKKQVEHMERYVVAQASCAGGKSDKQEQHQGGAPVQAVVVSTADDDPAALKAEAV